MDGYAVRLDWPGAHGVWHDFAQFTTSLPRALRRAESTRRFWAPGPLRPLAVTVVPIDRRAFRAHPCECTARSCPSAAPLLGLDPAGRPAAGRTIP